MNRRRLPPRQRREWDRLSPEQQAAYEDLRKLILSALHKYKVRPVVRRDGEITLVNDTRRRR